MITDGPTSVGQDVEFFTPVTEETMTPPRYCAFFSTGGICGREGGAKPKKAVALGAVRYCMAMGIDPWDRPTIQKQCDGYLPGLNATLQITD